MEIFGAHWNNYPVSQLIKFQPKFDPAEAYVAAMFVMWARAPRQERPDLDGFYELGEIGEAPEKEWTRLTPYSIAKREKHGHDASASQRILDI